jgi:hypothetical protein
MRLASLAVILSMSIVPELGFAQIGQPGAHPRYTADLEPHVLADWDNSPPCSSDGLGAGVRATIPFLQDGPVPGINNNMGLGLGADYAHRWANHCTGIVSANGLIIPVVLQWNFFLLRRLSVFGEAGVAWQHWWNTPYLCTFCGGYTSTNQLDVALAAGGRFMVTERFAFLLRLGWPYVSLGAVIQL